MKIAHIVPPEYVSVVQNRDLHMVIATIKDNTYRNFYRSLINKFIILDNGFFETGVSLDDVQLIRHSNIFDNSNTVVAIAPDVQTSGAQSLLNAQIMAHKIGGDKRCAVGVVIHADSLLEFISLMQLALSSSQINFIGIPYIFPNDRIYKDLDLERGKDDTDLRASLLVLADSIINIRSYDKVIHCLGLVSPLEVALLQHIGLVDSIDTSFAATAAIRRRRITSNISKIPRREDFWETPFDYTVATIMEYNIEFLDELCQTDTTIPFDELKSKKIIRPSSV